MIPSESDTRVDRPKRCTVLCVDDEPQVLAGLRNALRKHPFTILTATSGNQALELLAGHDVEVVVSDEQMPGMAGSELLSLVRERYPETIRIILTGQASLEAAIRAINEGEVYRFLSKPCNAAELAVTIQNALQLRDLARASSRLLVRAREQDRILRDLEGQYPGISEIRRDESGAILLDGIEGVDDLIGQIERENR